MLSSCETPASNSTERRSQHQSWKREQMPLWMNPRPEIRRGGQLPMENPHKPEPHREWNQWLITAPFTVHMTDMGILKSRSPGFAQKRRKRKQLWPVSLLDTMIQAITLKDDEELKWSIRHAPLLPLITSSHWHPWGFPENFWEHFEKHWCGT